MKNYITRYNNNHPLDFFGDAFDDFFRPLFYDEKLDSMKTDIKETATAYELDVEMPGFDKEDINIDVENGYMTIRAEKKEKERERQRRTPLREKRAQCILPEKLLHRRHRRERHQGKIRQRRAYRYPAQERGKETRRQEEHCH